MRALRRGPGPRPWQLEFALLTAVWGGSFLFIKVAVKHFAPVDVALGRVALGAAVLLIALAVQRTRMPQGREVWGHLFVVGLLGNAIPFTLLGYGEERISSVLAGIWNATTPLLTMLVAIAMLPDERPTPRRVAGLLAGFGGVIVVLGPWRSPGGSELLGQLMCLGAAACYGIAFPYTRRFLAHRPDSGMALSAGQLTCASLQLAVATAFIGGAPHGVNSQAVGSILALGVFGTGIAYILNYAVLRQAGATTASTVTYVVPIWSTLLGVTVLGEGLTWNEPLGAAIVLTSVAVSQGLVNRAGRRERQHQRAQGEAVDHERAHRVRG
ncbi:MAG: DMT family transporter [Thermoleophilaceae bacterium]